MKKIVKMSLVAAVAVAGLTTANAKPLEEAIKDVDVSGTVVYRYNEENRDDAASKNSTSQNFYKIGLNVSSKVNDDVKVNTRFLVGGADGGFVGLDTQTTGDSNVDVALSNVYFSYTGIANTTVNVGKQGLTTPWTVAIDSDGNEQTGTGILALSTWGPVTVAGAYFNQTNLGESGDLDNPYSTTNLGPSGAGAANIATDNAAWGNAIGARDIATLGVIGNVGPVTLDAWYLDLAETFDTYTLGAKASFDLDAVKLGADVRYTALDFDSKMGLAQNADDHDMVKLELTAKAGIVDALYRFAKTDKEGGIIALDNDVATTTQGWNVRADGEADSTYHQFVVGVQAMDKLHISANYVTKKYDEFVGSIYEDETTEIYAQLVYNMSKNLMTYVRFGTQENEFGDPTDIDTDVDYKGRLQIQYSF